MEKNSCGARLPGDGGGPHPTGGEKVAETDAEAIVSTMTASYNKRLIASASSRQYESATLPAKQLGQTVPDSPFSEKQQRESRYDGGLEEDGITPRRLLDVRAAEPLAHISRDRRRLNVEHQQHRNEYKEVPLTGCQLCIAPHYMLPQSFGQNCVLGDEGEIEFPDLSQLLGLPWVFHERSGELQHFMADLVRQRSNQSRL